MRLDVEDVESSVTFYLHRLAKSLLIVTLSEVTLRIDASGNLTGESVLF